MLLVKATNAMRGWKSQRFGRGRKRTGGSWWVKQVLNSSNGKDENGQDEQEAPGGAQNAEHEGADQAHTASQGDAPGH